MKRTCRGCYAMEFRGRHGYCDFHKKVEQIDFGMPKPLENCTKPMSIKSYRTQVRAITFKIVKNNSQTTDSKEVPT